MMQSPLSATAGPRKGYTAFHLAKGDEVSKAENRSNNQYDLTWTDSFYDNEPDIIAVFDVDYQNIRTRIIAFGTFLTLYLIFILSVPLIIQFQNIEDVQANNDDSMSVGSSALWLFLWIGLVAYFVIKKLHYQFKSATGNHVAITTKGIRKDMQSFPIGAIFRTTTVMPYDEIKSIYVRRCSPCSPCSARNAPAHILVTSKADGTQNILVGICNPEAFVDLVKDLMLQQEKETILQIA